jgi:hypothetical protein
MPGAVFYDVVGVDDVAELAAAAEAGIATVAEEAATLESVEAVAVSAEAEAPLVAEAEGADIAGTIGEAALDGLALAA